MTCLCSQQFQLATGTAPSDNHACSYKNKSEEETHDHSLHYDIHEILPSVITATERSEVLQQEHLVSSCVCLSLNSQ